MTKQSIIQRLMKAQEHALQLQEQYGDGSAFDFLFAAQAEIIKDWYDEARQ